MNDKVAILDAEAETAVAKVQASVSDLLRACPRSIATPTERIAGSSARRSIKERIAAIEGERKALVTPLNDTVKRINDLFRGPLDTLKLADETQRCMAVAYDQDQERLRKEEERRLNAIEAERTRKEREKIEQEAQRQRVIQEQKEREATEARRKAEEAEGAERKRLLAEAEAAERKAAAAAAKVEEKEEQASTVVEHTVTVSAPEKPKGESTRKLWSAKLSNKADLIMAASLGSDIAATCLMFDQVAANKLATALKGAVIVPGMDWESKDSLVMRGGKE